MKNSIPDYFLALVKQRANLVNDEQANRYVVEISRVLNITMAPNQAGMFFSLAPRYLRPHTQTFFSKLGGWQPKPKSGALPAVMQALSLTDKKEALVVLGAYFAAIRVVADQQTQLKILRTLPTDLATVYKNAY